jgi:hypothetical protein
MLTGTRSIHVYLVKHRESDLLIALSDDLRGLTVPGRTEEEVRDKLPFAIRQILEAEGQTVLGVEPEPTPEIPSSFAKHWIVANATLATAT